MLPGLNLHPQRMLPVARLVLSAGAAVVQPRLTGYAASFGDEAVDSAADAAWGRVRAQDWLADLDVAWAQVRERLPAAQPALLGYSLGALLGLAWAASRGIALRRAFLLAPALRPKGLHRAAIAVLGSVLPGRLRLPSLAPAAYRLRPTTPVAAFRALAALERQLRPHLERWLRGDATGLPPLLIACSARDELIDARVLFALAQAHPTAITTVPLGHAPRRGYPYHLGLDGTTLGEAEWQRLAAACTDWLRRVAPLAPASGDPTPGGRFPGTQAAGTVRPEER